MEMKKKGKLTAVLLSLVMCLSMMPTTAFANTFADYNPFDSSESAPAPISYLRLVVSEPEIGNTPDGLKEYSDDNEVIISKIFYPECNAEGTSMGATDKFEECKTYSARYKLKYSENSRYIFSKDIKVVAVVEDDGRHYIDNYEMDVLPVNDIELNDYYVNYIGPREVEVIVNFPTLGNGIYEINLTIDAPLAGKQVNDIVCTADNELGKPEYFWWREHDESGSLNHMSDEATFEQGKKYSVSCCFRSGVNKEFDKNVSVKVNHGKISEVSLYNPTTLCVKITFPTIGEISKVHLKNSGPEAGKQVKDMTCFPDNGLKKHKEIDWKRNAALALLMNPDDTFVADEEYIACYSFVIPEGDSRKFAGEISATVTNGIVEYVKRESDTEILVGVSFPKIYTVTFDANGHGIAPPAQKVQKGEKANKPANLTESGWTFEGWYTEQKFENKFDFETEITGDITLYAKWAKKTSGGGSGSGGSSGGGSSSGSSKKTDKTTKQEQPSNPIPQPSSNSNPAEIPVKNNIIKKQQTTVFTIGSNIMPVITDGKTQQATIDAKPFLIQGRTMIPVRYIAGSLGMQVEWNKQTQTVVLKNSDYTVMIPIKTNKIIIIKADGTKEEYTSDVTPVVKDGRTYLTISNLAKALNMKAGADIKWDNKSKTVTVTKEVEVR